MARQPPLVDEPEERKLLQMLDGRYRAWRSQYFSIITDAECAEVNEFERSADEVYSSVHAFMSGHGLALRSPTYKLLVVVLGDWTNYASWVRRAGLSPDPVMPGFFDEKANRCVLFDYAQLPLIRTKRQELADARAALDAGSTESDGATGPAAGEAAKKRDRITQIEIQLAVCELGINQTVVRHEIAHQVLYNLGVVQPGEGRLWLKEGLALQYESDLTFSGDRQRLADFFADDRNADLANLRSVVADPSRLAQGAQRLPEAYATAGALVCYLLQRKPDAFVKYLQTPSKAISQPAEPPANQVKPAYEYPETAIAPSFEGSARIAEFEAAFGTLNKHFELEFRQFLGGLRGSPLETSDADLARHWIQQKGIRF